MAKIFPIIKKTTIVSGGSGEEVDTHKLTYDLPEVAPTPTVSDQLVAGISEVAPDPTEDAGAGLLFTSDEIAPTPVEEVLITADIFADEVIPEPEEEISGVIVLPTETAPTPEETGLLMTAVAEVNPTPVVNDSLTSAISETAATPTESNNLVAAISEIAVLPADMSYDQMVLSHSPVAYWRLNDNTTTAVEQIAGRNGTYGGTYTQGVTGLVSGDTNKAVDFSAGHITVPHATAFNITTAITIEALVRADSLMSTNGDSRYIFHKNTFYYIYHFRTGGLNVFVGGIRTGGVYRSVISTATITAGQTYHVVMTYDKVNINLYVNAVAQTPTPVTTNIDTNANPITIGAFSTSNNNPFDGIADEIALYNVALTEADVRRHYIASLGHSGKTGLTAGVSETQPTPAEETPIAARLIINETPVDPADEDAIAAIIAEAVDAATDDGVIEIDMQWLWPDTNALSTGWTSPANAIDKNVATAATATATATGIGGVTNTTLNYDLQQVFPNVVATDLNIDSVEWTYRWQTASAGTQVSAGTVSGAVRYSTDDGGAYTLQENITAPVSNPGEEVVNMTSILNTWTKINQFRTRVNGSLTSGTGLNKAETLSWYYSRLRILASKTY